MSGVEQMSREELLVLVVAQARMIEEQAAALAVLTDRIVELERRLGRNSRNSSLPPSREGLDKPPPRSMRSKSGRKAGKQPGTPGTGLAQVAVPDRVVEHFPVSCGRCAEGLDRDTVVGEAVRRQVFDLPETRVEVTEHRLFAAGCGGCGAVTRAAAPTAVNAPACYGTQVTAMAGYLSAQHHIPVDRVVEILADLAGIEVSAGWVTQACARMADAVAGL